MKKIKTYRIETTFACGAVSVEGSKIIKKGTVPIFKKFIGKSLKSLDLWLLKKTGEVHIQEL